MVTFLNATVDPPHHHQMLGWACIQNSFATLYCDIPQRNAGTLMSPPSDAQVGMRTTVTLAIALLRWHSIVRGLFHSEELSSSVSVALVPGQVFTIGCPLVLCFLVS